MRNAAFMRGAQMAASLPTAALTESARAEFQDSYADVKRARGLYVLLSSVRLGEPCVLLPCRP